MSEEKKFCTQCGAENVKDNKFCTSCGEVFEEETDEKIIEQETETAETTEEVVEPSETPAEEPSNEPANETPVQPVSNQNKNQDTFKKIKEYVETNKKTVGIVAGVLIVLIIAATFLSGATQARGKWVTNDEEFYNRRERYTVDISRNGNAEVFVESSDSLDGTIKLNFSVVEDEWETTATRTAYVLDEVSTMEIVVPNLTYQQERGEILNEFGLFGVDYDIKEGKNDVTLTFDFSDHPDLLFGSHLETVIEFVTEDDRDNEHREDYVIFNGLEGRRELFNN